MHARALRWFGHLLLSILLVWSQTAPLANTAPALRNDARARELAAFLRAVRLYRERLDRSAFDPAALARRFGGDISAAFRFVRDEIALLPYRGTLRFAAGTLASRAGNSCDRALLLAALLEPAGYDVRFARARLAPEVVARLREHLDAPPTAASRPVAVDPYDPELAALFAPAGIDAEAFRASLEETQRRVRALAQALATDLAFVDTSLRPLLEGMPAPEPAALEARIREDLADHCWLQVKTDSGWLDLDPSLPGLEPGVRLAEPAKLVERLPRELAPALRLRLRLHRRIGERTESENILEKEVPLDGAFVPLRLLVMPEIRGANLVAPLLSGSHADGFEVFVPQLILPGERVVGRPFGLDGRSVPEDPQMRQAEAMGETVGGLFGGALGALGEALDEPAPEIQKRSEFAGLELELELQLADGERRISRRLLVKPVPEEELRWELFTAVELLATASRVPRSLLLDRELATILKLRPWLRAALRDPSPAVVDRLIDSVAPADLRLWEFAQLRSVFSEYALASAFPGLLTAPGGPLLVALHRRLALREGRPRERLVYDLVFDPQRLLPRRRGEEGSPREALRLLSVLDNVLEHMLAGGATARSGVSMLAAAREQNVPLRVLAAPGELEALSNIPDWTRRQMRERLEAGERLIAPQHPVLWRGAPLFAYWRYDPSSGTLLALGADGTGQAMSEYANQIKLIALGTIVGCIASIPFGMVQSAGDFASCVIIGMVVGLITAGVVGWLARKFGWTAGAMANAEAAAGGALGPAGSKALGHGEPSPKPAAPPPNDGLPAPPPPGPEGAPSGPSGNPLGGRSLAQGATQGGGGRAVASGPSGSPTRGGPLRIPKLRSSGSQSNRALETASPGSTVLERSLARTEKTGAAAKEKTPSGAVAEESEGAVAKTRTASAEETGQTSKGQARSTGAAEEGGEGAAKPKQVAAIEEETSPGQGGRTSGAAPETVEDARPAWLRELGKDEFELATPEPQKYSVLDNLTPEQQAWLEQHPDVRAFIKETNMPLENVRELMKLAKAHHAVIGTRTLNPNAPRHYAEGAVGKDMFMKGKSANRGAIAGLIPEDQALSKLYDRVRNARTPEERAEAWKTIAKYNKKVQEAVAKGDYEFMTFKVEGREVGVYRQGDRVYQAYEEGGVLYDATTRKPLGEASRFIFEKPLRVVGKRVVDPKTGKSVVRPVTADIDLDFVAFNPHAPASEISKKLDPKLGGYSNRVKYILEGVRNLAGRRGKQPIVLHGPEQFNPNPELLRPTEYPKGVFLSDGTVRILRNPYDQWKLFRDLRLKGWKNPLPEKLLRAWGWVKEGEPVDNWWKRPPEAVMPWAPLRSVKKTAPKPAGGAGGAPGGGLPSGQGPQPRRRRLGHRQAQRRAA